MAIVLQQTEPQWGGESMSFLIDCSVTKQKLRRGLPYDLESEMKGVKQKGEEVKTVSIGCNGDWFLRTNTRYGMSPPMPEPINSICPWLTQETTMPQRAKLVTVMGPGLQTWSNSHNKSKRAVSVSQTT
jgi:hypothetical protein